MTNEELKQLQVDAVLGKVYAKGVPPNKATASYIRAACEFTTNADGSPQLVLIDPSNGTHYANVNAFVESMAKDPDFKPKPVVNVGGEPEPVHVRAEDLAKVQPNLADVASGRVIVDFPEEAPIEPKKGEVHWGNFKKINESIEDIASGAVKVVR